MKMKYAVVDGERREAQPGLSAKCQGCGNPVVAKCGKIRIWHWAHLGKLTCDPWWENQTEWHRAWKNKFPAEWQEFPQYDPSGEKHIADIRANHGLVVEFQHSNIDSDERNSRERFYKNIWWVVDGTRLKRDYPRFLNGARGFLRTNKQDHFFVPEPEKCLPAAWLNSPVSVFIDFLGPTSTDTPDQMRNVLWQLLPGRHEGKAVIVAVSRARFVEAVLNGPPPALPVPAPPAVPQRIPNARNIRIDPRDLRFLNKLLGPSSQRPTWRPLRRRF